MIDEYNNEVNDKAKWEMYLHHSFLDKSFSEFESILENSSSTKFSKNEAEKTLKNTVNDVWKAFNKK